ncbi:MAG: divalent-cation tolerance protein CutA [Phyllobacteriaceae bacterium]|nr:divalent-cation tolerance protein CutA [Phyllobacteriaceae bacterium]
MGGDEPLVLIWSTWPDADTARRAARDLVEARLAACGVVLPAVASVYRWNGAIEEAEEAVLLVKTRAGAAAAATAAIERVHPYEVPAVLTLPIEAASAAYGAWVLTETDSPTT